MALNKDAILATVILIVCLVLIGIAFTEPSGSGVSEGEDQPVVAKGPTVPASAPQLPKPSRPADTRPTPEPSKPASRPTPEPSKPASRPTPEPSKPASRPTPEPSKPAVRDGAANLLALLEKADPLDDYDSNRQPSRPQRPKSQPSRPETQPTPTPTPSPSRPAQTADSSSSDREYTVQKGDTLGDISRQMYGSSRHWRRIQEANQIDDPAALRAGEKLRIPQVASSSSSPQPQPTTSSDGKRQYTVKRGDSYYLIAQRQLGDANRWQEIKALNNVDSYSLAVGQTILLPEAGSAPANRSSSTTRTPAGATVHVVAKGEILGTISQRYYGTAKRWREIAAANDISDPIDLRVGQRLIIPDAPASSSSDSSGANTQPSSTSSTSSPSSATTGTGYTISSGDTLIAIAKREYGDPEAYKRILAANPGLNANRLVPGQRIVLPGKEAEGRSQPSRPAPPPRKPSPTPPVDDTEDRGPSGLQELLRRAQGNP